ncbi:MAG TPA: hypothetical protein VN688_33420 [Gemmataceae bacterium]|nr:hypothetical protein [Gemmataceae bacterium]
MNHLEEAIHRVESLYWDCHRNGGPDVELLAILTLLKKAEMDLETVELTLEPPRPLRIVRP